MPARFDLLKRHGGEHGLRQALASNAGLLGEVHAEIAALKGVHPDRCVVTSEYRDALSRVIEGLG